MIDNNKPLSLEERKNRVFELTKDMEQLVKEKKASSQGYNNEIKRLKAEIKEYINPSNPADLP